MTRSRFLLPVVFAVACLGTWIICRNDLLAQQKPPHRTGNQWEYKVVYEKEIAELGSPHDGDVGFESEQRGLDKMGSEGWELVAICDLSPGSQRDARWYYLKRPKSDP